MTTTTTASTANTATTTSATNPTNRKKPPTHDLFDVQEREGRNAFWNKVGAAFENRDGSHTVRIYQPGRPDSKSLQLRAIDRQKRPLKEGADPQRSPTHELFLVVEVENAPNEWRRVGVAFTNRDGSLSLVVDDGNREGPKARFQMRLHRPAQAERAPEAIGLGARETQPASPGHGASAGTEEERGDVQAAQKSSARPRTVVRKNTAAA